jgi:hypothetical protein
VLVEIRMRIIIFYTVVFIILMLLSCVSADTEKHVLKLKSVHRIELDAGALPLLSPDGTMMAMCAMNYILVWTSGGKQLVEVEALNDFDRFSLSWSPDSKFLTATDDFLHQFKEPDIWILDVTSGKLENLTDDDVPAFPIAKPPPPEANLDMSPSWSGDGTLLYFFRIRFNEYDESMSLMRFNLSDRTISTVKEIQDPRPWTQHNLAVDMCGDIVHLYQQDDTFIMYSPDPVFESARMPVSLDLQLNDPFQVYGVGYSADRGWLCIRISNFTGNERVRSVSGHDLVFMTQDSEKFVLRSTETHTITGFCWDPFKGHAFIYTLITPEKSGLYWSTPNGKAELLLKGHFIAEGYYAAQGGSPLKWAHNGTVLLYDYKENKLFLAELVP